MLGGIAVHHIAWFACAAINAVRAAVGRELLLLNESTPIAYHPFGNHHHSTSTRLPRHALLLSSLFFLVWGRSRARRAVLLRAERDRCLDEAEARGGGAQLNSTQVQSVCRDVR